MNPCDVTQGFLERAEADPPPPERLTAEILKTVEALGFRHFACCSQVDPFHPPRDAVMLHNYPRGWVRTFSEAKLYEIDPVLLRARSNPFPFYWDTAFPSGSLTKSQRIILADAAGYGLAHGFTVPVTMSWHPGVLRGSCSVVPDSGRLDAASYLAIEALAKYFFLIACRAHAPWLAPPGVELTHRERQCLALVAQGKSDRNIGRALGMAECTAHHHVEHAKRRLLATTRPQAVARAFMTGQLTSADLARQGDASSAHPDGAPPTDPD